MKTSDCKICRKWGNCGKAAFNFTKHKYKMKLMLSTAKTNCCVDLKANFDLYVPEYVFLFHI